MLLTADLIASLQLARVLSPTVSSPLHPQHQQHAHHHHLPASPHSPAQSSSYPSSYCSLDWDSSGEWAAVASSDDALQLYNADSGAVSKALQCRPFGCAVVRFTHHAKAVIVASASVLRYLSLHDNRYLRTFAGHSAAVTAVSLSPVDDTFLSAAADSTVRLWDLRSPGCRGILRCSGEKGDADSVRPSVAFDPQGLIFAVSSSPVLKLYDQRSYAAGPFSTFVLPDSIKSDSTSSMQFAPDGQTLLLAATPSQRIVLLDAFDGRLRRSFDTRSAAAYVSSPPPSPQPAVVPPLSPSFSPDAQFVFAGAADGSIAVFDKEAEEEDDDGSGGQQHRIVDALSARFVFRGHTSPVRCVAMSPTRLCLLSAATEVGLWLPSADALRRAAERSDAQPT